MSRSILSSAIIKPSQFRSAVTPLWQLQATRQSLGARPAITAIAAFHTPASRSANRNENKPSVSKLDFLDPPSTKPSASINRGSAGSKQVPPGNRTVRSPGSKGPASSSNSDRSSDPFELLDGKKPAASSATKKPTAPLDRPPRDEEIQAQWIQFINEDGHNEGQKRLTSVLRSIDRKEYFLIQVDANTNPPICKVFSKSELFQKAKKEKQSKKANEVVTKELQLNWGTAEHDLAHKLNKYKGFLLKGYRVDVHITGRKGKSSTKEDREAMLERIKAELEPEAKYVRPMSWSNEVTANMLLQGNKKQ
ncbi:hypothetical protein DFQ26_001360 [Actinomortierella ambigua]|nr:hypothetical protein DFQ26_001360 [Actinomortierella ambigua]